MTTGDDDKKFRDKNSSSFEKYQRMVRFREYIDKQCFQIENEQDKDECTRIYKLVNSECEKMKNLYTLNK